MCIKISLYGRLLCRICCVNLPHSPLVFCGVLSPWVRNVPVELRVDNATAASMVKGVRGKDLGEVNWLRDTRLKGWLLRI